MKHAVVLEESAAGLAASVPGLPGCRSQGDTEAEAIANTRDAIREYREVAKELAQAAGSRRIAVEA